jgi:phosphate-selective porin OprO/OprP
MKGKTALMAGAAAIALIVSGQAAEAKKHHHRAPPPEAGEPSSTPSSSAAPPPSNEELARRLQAVEDAMEANEAKEDSDHTRLSTLEQNFSDVQWSFDNARPTVKTGDGRFSLAIRARFQADFAGFMNDAMHANGPPPASASWNGKGHLSSGGVIRRAYFGVEAARSRISGTNCASTPVGQTAARTVRPKAIRC